MSFMPRLSVLLLLFCSALSQAADSYVPPELQAWEAWVLDGKEYRSCPFFYNAESSDQSTFICTWPGRLDMAVTEEGGRFAQQWAVLEADAWLPLPGSTEYWPDRVTINGRPAIVVLHSGVPSIRVTPGQYRLSGQFSWDERPGVLRVPPASGLISLTVNGERISRPEVDRNGVFLGERERESQARDAVSVQVYRLVVDDIPTRLVTQLQVEVAGSVREEMFGPLLPQGFVPLSINSALPVRLESDGRMRVQVRPGRWQISLTARAPDVLNAVSMIDAAGNLPDTEIWSYQANDRLRVTAAEGLPPVDPSRVQVPDNWSELPAFRISRGETLTIVERSRGMASAENDLRLARSMWLDFDGEGFVVKDSVNGTMREGWRLDMQPPFSLQSATEDNESLLITLGERDGLTGVELRDPDVNLIAFGRTDSRGEIPVSGWDARFAKASTTLFLPPGHKLLAAPGVDSAHGSWVGQWQLLDFFLVLIITIAAWKLFGRNAGLIALFALVLSYHEINAPAWLWLNILLAIALLRVAPAGRLQKFVRAYFGISALLLVFALVPFIASQMRIAIYPQLEPQWGMTRSSDIDLTMTQQLPETMPAKAARRGIAEADQMDDRAVAMEELIVTGNRVQSTNFARYAPNAIVQAGPGIPSWQWNGYSLNWSGPVDTEQSMRLVILPRWVVSLLRVIETAFLILFAAVLAAGALRKRIELPGGIGIGRSATASLLTAVVAAGLLATPSAHAEIPNAEILQELERRLLAAPECVPQCADIVDAKVEVDESDVSIRLTIHALDDVAVPLPGSSRGWRPEAVVVEGSASAEVYRSRDQNFWLRVPEGRHTVSLRGRVGSVDNLEIAFPASPRLIAAEAGGWFIAGIKDRRLLSGSLHLTRLQSSETGDGRLRWESSRFPPFVQVTRNIELGLDWRVTTRVQRIAPVQGAITLELPLIEGESVLSDNMTVRDGKILVSMNPTQGSVTWQSNLPRTSPTNLTSEAGAPWKEVWYVNVGSVWHAQFSGVRESESGGRHADVRTAEFFPRGGESLQIVATRPEAAAGTTLAFDSVGVNVQQGARSRTSTMNLSYRSTRGAQHVIRLPADADVTRVTIDGRTEPLRADDGEMTLQVLPGEHTINIEWREDVAATSRTRTPVIDLGAAASNITMQLNLPANRWLLGTDGPALGPAVLYWSELAIMILLALALGRIDWTPLSSWQWLLLGIGFSTFSWPVLGFVAAWLVVVGARDRFRSESSWWLYNLQQAGVVVMTVIALVAIVTSLPNGLLGTPDMHVAGNNSWGNQLVWFADRSDALLPGALAISAPMWIYKALILAWALWLSFALLKWLPWTWQCFARDGFFRSRKGIKKPAEAGET